MSTIMKSNQVILTADPGMNEIYIVKEFNIDRELIFKAFTDPFLYARWIGPNELSMKIEKFEPRNGGSYRFIQKDKDGKEYTFHGVYHEVLAPERIISTMEYDGITDKGHVEFDTANFEALPDFRTRLTIHAIYQSIEDRDRMLNSGMGKGVEEGFERLEEILSKDVISWDI